MATCCMRWLPLLRSERMFSLWQLKLLLQQVMQRRRVTNPGEEKCHPDLHKEEALRTWWGLGGVAVREPLDDTTFCLCISHNWWSLVEGLNGLPFELGYQLCDNSVGVLFNDSTRLIMYNDGDSLQYIEQNNTESYFTVRSYPSALNKKVSPGDRNPHWGWLLLMRLLPALLGFVCRVGSREKYL